MSTSSRADDFVTTERDGNGVALVQLNRPPMNPLSQAMLGALRDAGHELAADASLKAVVVTGSDRAFAAGADIDEFGDSETARGIAVGFREAFDAVAAIPRPVIAAIHGYALGGGLELAMACDLRVAADNAVLLTSFARVGFSGDWGGTFFLTQIVGSARARELYYLSERIDASEALRIGLVNRVVPAAELEKQTRELALRIASGPTVAYRYMKENLNRAASGAGVLECLDLEATHHVHTGQTEDHKEAARAFVEKRTPVFRGR